MKVDDIKTELKKSFDELKEAGVKFRDRVELYSMKPADYVLGEFTGEVGKIETKFGEQPYFIFNVEKAKLTDRAGNRVPLENVKVGVLANQSLKNLLTTELVLEGDEWERKPIDRKGHKISVLYEGKETKKVGKKTISVGKFNFHDLTLEK